MSPDFHKQWEHILEDVEKSKIPVQFLKKLVVKLKGKKQFTINIVSLMRQGLDPDQVEEAINRKLHEMDDDITGIEFILNVESIAEAVQPQTDKYLSRL